MDIETKEISIPNNFKPPVKTKKPPPNWSVSDYWSQKTGYAPNWYSFCSSYICKSITGDQKVSPTNWAIQKYAGKLPVNELMEIGCLSGDKVFSYLEMNIAEKVHGIDIAEAAIERGRQKYSHLSDKVALDVVDLNRPTLDKSRYDVILSNGVLHHIARLEACIESLYDSLKPGGILIASEFTGPQRYEYSAKELALIHHGDSMLPAELRAEQPFCPSQLANKLKYDLSESIRTRDIEPVLRSIFEKVDARPYGGNILMRALSATFFQNFNSENIEHVNAVKNLIEFDQSVSRKYPSHHQFFIARKANPEADKNASGAFVSIIKRLVNSFYYSR